MDIQQQDIVQEYPEARQRLMIAAKHLFSEHGYDAVSTRMIAQEAGVNLAMISYYFGSKEQLFKAIFEELLPQFRKTLLAFKELQVGHWQKWCMVMDAYVDRILLHCNFSKLMYRELSYPQRPEIQSAILNTMEGNWKVLSSYITDGQAEGAFRKDIDVEMVLTTFFGTVVQTVQLPALAGRVLGLREEELLGEAHRNRLKQHLKELSRCHLLSRPE